MRIGLNLQFLVPGETGGTEVYVRGLVPELATVLGADRLTMFAAPELAAELDAAPLAPGARVVALRTPGRSRVRRTLGEQTLLPLAVRRAGIDVLHNLQSTAPVWSGARASVTTIHDLIYLHEPAAHAGLLARGMGFLVPLAARRSDRLIAVSRATKDDLVASLGVDPAKVDVVHHGPGLQDGVAATDPAELRRRLGLDDAPIVLSPAAARAHKNLPRLLAAFAQVDVEPAPTLVLPGYTTGAGDELVAQAASLGIGKRVTFPGWVSDTDLAGLYNAATALVFPSLIEGFGLPVLEAMRRGLPVACADRTSLPEIAGNAALLFDPESVDAIVGAITILLADGELREHLSEAGRRRAQEFSWARAARETVEVYERALRSAR